MRFIVPQWRSCEQIVCCLRGPFSARGAVEEVESALKRLARLARVHWIFAISEISKGLAIVTIGDMVIAEDLGEAVRVVAVALPGIRGGTPADAIGLARASSPERGTSRLIMVIQRLRRNSELCS
jgi:hypothetical protein